MSQQIACSTTGEKKVIYATNVLSTSDVDVTNLFCSHEEAGVPSTACKKYRLCRKDTENCEYVE